MRTNPLHFRDGVSAAFGGRSAQSRTGSIRHLSPIHSRTALTVLEMLVATTLLVFIVVGLTAMFVQTQKAFKAGTRQTTVTDSGRTVVDLISADLAQMSDAQNLNLINLFFMWSPTNSTTNGFTGAIVTRTNQEQEIFFLVQTNAQWLGIGYAMSNTAPGVGTLYRYFFSVPFPLTNNILFNNFSNAVINQTFGPNFGRVAEGVIHLKIRAYDQFGNECPDQDGLFGNDYLSTGDSYAYPLYTNALPNSVQLEVGVLDPDTYAQAKALSLSPSAQTTLLNNAAANINIFRENIPIAAAAR